MASKKYTAALAGVGADGRIRGQFKFFGAHTGRWSGRGVQLQNLPRAQLYDKGMIGQLTEAGASHDDAEARVVTALTEADPDALTRQLGRLLQELIRPKA